MKKLILRNIIPFAIFAFLSNAAIAADGTKPGQSLTRRTDGGITVLQPASRNRPAHFPKISKSKTFDRKKLAKSLNTLKRVSVERAVLRNIHQSAQKTERSRAARKMAMVRVANRTKIFGKTTRFLRAPSVPKLHSTSRGDRIMATNAQLDGKSQDTILVDDPFALTFSFAPGNISAILNVYLDADSDGVVSTGDILLEGDILLLDNDDIDSDPATGTCKIVFQSGDIFSKIVSSMIFEVNNYQTVSSAMVTIRQKPAGSVITGKTNPPMPYIVVALNQPSNTHFVFTDAAGRYSATIAEKPPAEVNLLAEDINGVSNGFVPPAQKTVDVSAETTKVDFTFTPSTSFIDGFVRDQSGMPVKNLMLGGEGLGYQVLTRTDSTGYYKIGVAPGQWAIFDEPEPPSTYLINQSSPEDIEVLPHQTIHENLMLLKSNSSISGKVSFNGAGVGGVLLETVTDTVYNIALTSSDGTYSMPVFTPTAGTMFYDLYAELNSLGYTAVNLSQVGILPGASNVNFQLEKVTGGIKGTITDIKTGKPVAKAFVSISGTEDVGLMSDDTGYYHTSLLDGHYSVTVDATPYYTYNSNYMNVSGTVVTLNAGLQRSGSISGTVKDQSGRVLLNAILYAVDTTAEIVGSGVMDSDTSYIISGISGPKDKVYVSLNGYISEWYNNAASFDAAATIPVSDGYDTPNINFVLSKGGSISGKVADKLGHPISGAEVLAIDSLYDESYTVTDDSGYYQITGLVTASYDVIAGSDPYIDQWYNGVLTLDKATKVNVVVNQNTPNINFALSLGASVSGFVRDQNGAGIESADVQLLDSTLALINEASPDANGYYAFPRVVPGSKVFLLAQAYGYAERWYNNVSSADSATYLIFQEGELRSDIDFTLPLEGSISGVVRNDGGQPLPFAQVYVEDTAGTYSDWTSADMQGKYTVTNLNDGKYYVEGLATGYLNQWFDHKTSLQSANAVTVLSANTTLNINFYLHNYSNTQQDSIVARIKLAGLPDSLTFSQSFVGEYETDYWWGIRFDMDGNAKTGPDGCEVELALLHYKLPGDVPTRSTVLDATYHELLVWDSTNSGQWEHSDVAVQIDALDRNTLILSAPKSWPELSSINSGTKYDVNTYYMDQNGSFSDVTSVVQGGGLTDPSSDVPYNFIDILSASWAVKVVENVPAQNEIPLVFALRQNYPNPFNPSTMIAFDLPHQSFVSLRIYNVLGQEVAQLVDELRPAGSYREQWNASNLASGIYFYTIRTETLEQTKKMVLLK